MGLLSVIQMKLPLLSLVVGMVFAGCGNGKFDSSGIDGALEASHGTLYAAGVKIELTGTALENVKRVLKMYKDPIRRVKAKRFSGGYGRIILGDALFVWDYSELYYLEESTQCYWYVKSDLVERLTLVVQLSYAGKGSVDEIHKRIRVKIEKILENGVVGC